MRSVPTPEVPELGTLCVDECVATEILEFIGHIHRWALHLVDAGCWKLEIFSPDGSVIVRESVRDHPRQESEHPLDPSHGPRLRMRVSLEGIDAFPAECLCPPPVPFPWDNYGFTVGGDLISFSYKRGSLFEPEKPQQRLARRLRNVRQ